jgi:hypothetical protein
MQEGVQADHRTEISVIGRIEWCGTTLALVVYWPEPSEGGPRGPRGEEEMWMSATGLLKKERKEVLKNGPERYGQG